MTFHKEDTMPIFFANTKKLRELIISEEINIIHFHQVFIIFTKSISILGLYSVLKGRSLGITTIYTDHSLLSFGDLAGVSLNKVVKVILTDIDQCITVSYIGRDNFLLRTGIDPCKITVLPNAIVNYYYQGLLEILT